MPAVEYMGREVVSEFEWQVEIPREHAERAKGQGSGLVNPDGEPGSGISVIETFDHLVFGGPTHMAQGCRIGFVAVSRGLC